MNNKELLNNKNFWISFFISTFFLAYDETQDLDLFSFLYDNYDTYDAYEWYNSFTNYTNDILEFSDGYIENPTTVEFNLNNNNLKIEFHPCGVIYYLDNLKMATLDGEYIFNKTISWNKVQELISNIENLEKKFKIMLLLLPILQDDYNSKSIEKDILSGLELMPFDYKDHQTITKLLINQFKNVTPTMNI